MAGTHTQPEADSGLATNASLAVALGVFCTLCCCLPGGVVAIVLAHQARTAHARGDHPTCAARTRTSFVVSGLCIAFAMLLLGLWVFAILFSEIEATPPWAP